MHGGQVDAGFIPLGVTNTSELTMWIESDNRLYGRTNSAYSEQRTADAYPAYQLGWFPDFPDADNYLSPFLSPYSNCQGCRWCCQSGSRFEAGPADLNK